MLDFTSLLKNINVGISTLFLSIAFSVSSVSMAAEPVGNTQNNVLQAQSPVENSPVQSLPNSTPNANATINSVSPVNTPKSSVTKTDSASQLASVIGGLAIILILIYGLSWFVKRFAQGGFMQNPGMKMVSSMALGTRERLMLVEVGGKQILLGVTATQINNLHVFDEPVIVAEKTQAATSEFSHKLMAILQKNQNPDIAADKKSNS
jgi:flagellar protein FliO/FliZ